MIGTIPNLREHARRFREAREGEPGVGTSTLGAMWTPATPAHAPPRNYVMGGLVRGADSARVAD